MVVSYRNANKCLDCWGEDNQILNWMAGHHVTSFDELMQIYENKVTAIFLLVRTYF